MKRYKVLVFVGGALESQNYFYDSKKLDKFVEERYLLKMNHVGRGAGFKKYTMSTGTSIGSFPAASKWANPRKRSKGYSEMIEIAERVDSLKIEITSELDPLLK